MRNKEFIIWVRNGSGFPAKIDVKDGYAEIISMEDPDGEPFLVVVRGPADNLNFNGNDISYISSCKKGTSEEYLSKTARQFGNDDSIKKFLMEYSDAEYEDGVLTLDISKMFDW